MPVLKTKKLYYGAEDVASILDYSKQHAYRVIKKLNAELEADGKFIRPGKVPIVYFKQWFAF